MILVKRDKLISGLKFSGKKKARKGYYFLITLPNEQPNFDFIFVGVSTFNDACRELDDIGISNAVFKGGIDIDKDKLIIYLAPIEV